MTAPTRPPARPVTPVGILAQELALVAREVARLPGVDPGTTERLERAVSLAAGLDPYVERCTTAESDALRRLVERTQDEDWAEHAGTTGLEQEMLSGHVEGQLLKLLVHLTGARRVLEIGMFTGYSALAMAEALPEGGTLVACEVDAFVAAFARRCFAESPAGARIDVRVAPAQDTLRALAAAGDCFDLVFVDADKAGYSGYLTTLLETGLLAPGGLVAVDNTLMQGQPYLEDRPTSNGLAIASFNEGLAEDPRVEQVLLPLRDGLTLIRRA